MMKKILGLSKQQILLVIGAWAVHFLAYCGGRALAIPVTPCNIAVPIDSQIPRIPWTVLIYWGGVFFWIVNYIAGVKYDKGNGYRFIAAHLIGVTISFFFFVFFPVEISRTAVTGHTFCECILKLTYQVDEGNNCFPSMHCFFSWLSWIGVRRNRYISGIYQFISFLIAVSICISTLTVKQHYLVDVPAGIILAEISYLIAAMIERSFEKKKPCSCMDSLKDN